MATNLADTILGGVGDEVLDGLDGNDSIDGGTGGVDTLIGGLGDDLLWTRTSDEAYGGSGDDIISVAGDQPGVLDGGIGTDTLRFESNYDITGSVLTGIEQLAIAGTATMTATQLDSFLSVSGYNAGYTSANVALSLGGTADIFLSSTLTSSFGLAGSSQADLITFNPTFGATIYAYMGAGNDSVTTGAGNDSIRGEDGRDTLSGLDGNDSIDGGLGGDSMLGGLGDDLLVIFGADTAVGGDGNDLLSINSSFAAVLNGGIGQDTVRFENSFDISSATISSIENLNLYGNDSMTAAQLDAVGTVSGYNSSYTTGAVTLTLGGTASVVLSSTLSTSFSLTGSSQADILTFSAGYFASILLNAGAGNDRIVASSGSDSLLGGDGRDTLLGMAGLDTLDGNLGADSLDGGAGNDLLWVSGDDSALGGIGDDLFGVYGNAPAALDGGAGTDTLRFENGYDITGTTLVGIERLNLYGSDSMTAAQLDQFTLVSGYNAAYTTAALVLTHGGTADVTLSASLTNNFSLTGSSEAEAITFAAGYVGTIYAYLGGGNDSVVGSSGNDSLRGDDGDDTLIGSGGIDSIDGGSGNDSLVGGAGNDILIARFGDHLFGGINDDLVSVAENKSAEFDGGTGQDTLRFETSFDITGASIVGFEQLNLNGSDSMTAAQLGSFTTVAGYNSGYTTAAVVLTEGGVASINVAPTVTSYFSLTGSGDAETLTFAAAYLGTIYAYVGGGDDNVISATGNDSLRGDDGNDTLSGLSGNDSIDGGNGNDVLLGGAGDDFLEGSAGKDSLDGGAGNDYLVARQGDSLYGGTENDLVAVAESLPAILNGGTGIDTLRFENSYDISTSTLIGFENLNVSGTASMTAAQLAQFKLVSGYASNYTTAAVKLTDGGTVAVTLSSTLTGGFVLTGSADADIISFKTSYIGPITVYGNYGNDSITGATGNDNLRGEQGNDTLVGLTGNDTQDGGSGNDVLIGGSGIDSLTGGIGMDRFVFGAATDSKPLTPDRINDFEAAGAGKGDLIDVSGIDADGVLGAQDSFIFGATGLAGLSLVDSGTDTLVRLNTDNDAAFEVVILIADGAVAASSYTAADFVL